MNNIETFLEGDIDPEKYGINFEEIRGIAGSVLQYCDVDSVNVSIIFTDNARIQEINRDYRGKDYPTDVISFAYREEKFPGIDEEFEELGDIYISLEKTESQSVEFEVTFFEELLRLVIHGILHLIGYDHEISDDEEKRMQLQEEMVLQHILNMK